MLEIIALIYLSIRIKKIVLAKGLRPTRYIVTMLLLWMSLELLGLAAGNRLFESEIAAYLIAIAGACIGGYLGYKVAINAEPASATEE